jgi:hypothetical protein
VTAVRLGVYNGLHLIARAHYLHASIASVLTHDVADPVLEREARAYGTAFLVLPCPGDVLVGAVRESIVTASKSSELCISQRKVSAGEDSAVAAGATFLLTADTAIV